MVQKSRILFLAANPESTSRLDLEEELRSLEGELRSVSFRDQIELRTAAAVRPDDVVRLLRSYQPTIVHFSGHGSEDGIVLRTGQSHVAVSGDALARVISDRGVELVVLNSCFSDVQAEPLAAVVPAVVGTRVAVGDEAARRFSTAFYRTLGDGHTVGEAFRDGRDAVDVHMLDDVFEIRGDRDRVLVGAPGEPVPPDGTGGGDTAPTPTRRIERIAEALTSMNDLITNPQRGVAGLGAFRGSLVNPDFVTVLDSRADEYGRDIAPIPGLVDILGRDAILMDTQFRITPRMWIIEPRDEGGASELAEQLNEWLTGRGAPSPDLTHALLRITDGVGRAWRVDAIYADQVRVTSDELGEDPVTADLDIPDGAGYRALVQAIQERRAHPDW